MMDSFTQMIYCFFTSNPHILHCCIVCAIAILKRLLNFYKGTAGKSWNMWGSKLALRRRNRSVNIGILD